MECIGLEYCTPQVVYAGAINACVFFCEMYLHDLNYCVQHQ